MAIARLDITTKSFWIGYARPLGAATLVFLGVGAVGGMTTDGPNGIATAMLMGVFLLPYLAIGILIVGMLGLVILSILNWTRWQCYVGMGGVLGVATGGLLFSQAGTSPLVLWCSLLSITGGAAAGVYWRTAAGA